VIKGEAGRERKASGEVNVNCGGIVRKLKQFVSAVT
jgi:hypothetical protein